MSLEEIPFGHTAWSAPYRSVASHVLSSSVVAPMSLHELAVLTDVDTTEFINPTTVFDYGPTGGSVELREAVVSGMPGLIPDNVAISSGAGDALATVARLLCVSDRHVIVSLPSHESVVSIARASGVDVTFVPPPLSVDDILPHIRPNTAAAFLSSPQTPTGQVVPAESLTRLAQELARHGGLLIVDEVFRGVPMGVPAVPLPVASLVPNGVSIGSLSKVHGLPGLRLGWVAGPTLLVDDVRSMQRWTSRMPSTTSEPIAILALRNADALLGRARSLIYDSFAEFAALVDHEPGLVDLCLPDGGTTAFPAIHVPNADAWCNSVAEEYGLLLAPGGICFGMPGRFRINLGLRPEVRSAAFPILARALAHARQLQT
ncbi:aminotransferase class I/II-fold pyridoxal phosphate-dependent enzyme [Mycobacterium sp. 4D054]|uniref:aminotransferase class I/II-fold pyridoxal phosphate-dependent enzyme n=1 Tax=Mycobacterium sp. 4D054 TaxID=3457440 RepID=UPI003FD43442